MLEHKERSTEERKVLKTDLGADFGYFCKLGTKWACAKRQAF